MPYAPAEEAAPEATMELLQTIKLFSIPAWVKFTIAALLTVLGVINTVLFVFGILDAHREDLVKASIELLSVVLPIFIVALLIWKSDAGIDALRRKTEDFFLTLLPDILSRIHEDDASFFEAKSTATLLERKRHSHVYTNLQKGECYADVITFIPREADEFLELVIRLEVNVKRINFNLCFDEAHIRNKFKTDCPDKAADHKVLCQWVFSLFEHTTGWHRRSIEKGHEAIGPGLVESDTHEHDEKKGGFVYSFNSTMLHRRVAGRDFLCLVASCYVPSDFLWDPSERLFFAQDILFFLRGFITEEESCFRRVRKADLHTEVRSIQSRKGHGEHASETSSLANAPAT